MEIAEKLKQKFHLATGTYIAGKIFTEYTFLLKDELNNGIRGEKTLKNRLIESDAKAIKVINILAEQLKAIGLDLSIPETQVEGIEDAFYKFLQLEEFDQKRVLGLINKIQKEK
jgi:hypothetical protein